MRLSTVRARRATGGHPTPCGASTARRQDNEQGLNNQQRAICTSAGALQLQSARRPETVSVTPPATEVVGGRPAGGCCRSKAPSRRSGRAPRPSSERSTRALEAASGRSQVRGVGAVSSVLARRGRGPKPLALLDVSLGRALGIAEANPRTAAVTRCPHLPSAVGGRVDPCRAKSPTSVQSHPRDTVAAHARPSSGPVHRGGAEASPRHPDRPTASRGAARAPEHMELVTESPSLARRPSAKGHVDVHQGSGGVATTSPGDPLAA